MKKPMTRRKVVLLSISLSLAALLLVGVVVAALYVGDYYRPTAAAVAAMAPVEADGTTPAVKVMAYDDRTTLFVPDDPTVGFVFYPGGKVDHVAYAPLMQALAARGVLCVLLEMPLRLAVLDAQAAEGLPTTLGAQYPTVTSWYVGGHSLGGSMAASHAAKALADWDGLVLLAAYSTADLRESDLRVISVYGSEDQVMNRGKYDTYKENLPTDLTEYVIPGGNHAGFGAYGAQAGDGVATITGSEQITLTADRILAAIQDQ